MDPNTIWEGTANPPNYSKLYPSPTSFQKVRLKYIGIDVDVKLLIPSPVQMENTPFGMWKFPTRNLVSFRGCLIWTGEGMSGKMLNNNNQIWFLDKL